MALALTRRDRPERGRPGIWRMVSTSCGVASNLVLPADAVKTLPQVCQHSLAIRRCRPEPTRANTSRPSGTATIRRPMSAEKAQHTSQRFFAAPVTWPHPIDRSGYTFAICAPLRRTCPAAPMAGAPVLYRRHTYAVPGISSTRCIGSQFPENPVRVFCWHYRSKDKERMALFHTFTNWRASFRALLRIYR